VAFVGTVIRARVALRAILAFPVPVIAALLPTGGAARDMVLSWQETVQIEHRDRTERLRRLSDQALAASPRFFEERVSRGELPATFGTDIPVLRVVFPQRVFFDTDAFAVRAEAQAVIDVVAAALRREASDTAVFIAGHTDDRGSDAYNYALSVKRADSVAQALAARGVRQASVWRVGFGEAIPVVPNTSDTAMGRNRRVEFLFGRKAEAVGVWLAKQETRVCAGAGESQRAECLRAFAALPRVEAAPVRTGREARTLVRPPPSDAVPVLPTIETKNLVAVGPPVPPALVAPERIAPALVPAPPIDRTVVTITRDEPVIIDLREKRVLVERLER
jgi:outer membrane protein OmpA-like peptidoglycan-associated protein